MSKSMDKDEAEYLKEPPTDGDLSKAESISKFSEKMPPMQEERKPTS